MEKLSKGMSLSDAYMHLQYVTASKVYNKTDKDREALEMDLDALAKVEAMNQILEEVKDG